MKTLLQKITLWVLIWFLTYQWIVVAQTAMWWWSNHCGDGNLAIQLWEECDDGNYISGDGCSSNCEDESKTRTDTPKISEPSIDPDSTTTYKVFKIGKTVPTYINSSLSARELCDQWADNGIVCEPWYGGKCTYCSEVCSTVTVTGPICGDGIVQHEFEQCDDGNLNNGDGCNAYCKKENAIVVQVPTPTPTTQQPRPLIVIPAQWIKKPLAKPTQNNPITSTPEIIIPAPWVKKPLPTNDITIPKEVIKPIPTLIQEEKTVTVVDVPTQKWSVQLTPKNQDTTKVAIVKITKDVLPLTLTPVYAVCGDGIKQLSEQCDDGNLTNDDGCSSACRIQQARVLPANTAPAKVQARSQSVIRTTPAGEGIWITNPYPSELWETWSRLPLVHVQTIYLFLSLMISWIWLLLFRWSKHQI